MGVNAQTGTISVGRAFNKKEKTMANDQQHRHHNNDESSEDTAVANTKESPEFDVEDILNEIDDVLEENAEQFVAEYIQKGGQ